MYQLAACPTCETLQLHRDLDDGEARECRVCEEPVPAGDWSVREEHEAFEDARDRLRRLRDRTPDPEGFSSGLPVPDARLPLQGEPPGVREALREALRELADAPEPVPEADLVEALAEAGAGHLRSHLLREGILVAVEEGGEGEPAYRVREDRVGEADG